MSVPIIFGVRDPLCLRGEAEERGVVRLRVVCLADVMTGCVPYHGMQGVGWQDLAVPDGRFGYTDFAGMAHGGLHGLCGMVRARVLRWFVLRKWMAEPMSTFG